MQSTGFARSTEECARGGLTINSPPLDPQTDLLIVFAKIPIPGLVKTRLSPELTPVEAAALYEAFLYDALDQYSNLGCSIRLYVAPHEHESLSSVPEFASLYRQRGTGLGERMHNALHDSSKDGFDRMVIIGTDHPTLPTHYVVQAFRSMRETSSICLGPADDGGYYLIGLREPAGHLFDGQVFSHESVFEETVQRVRTLGLILTVLPSWYDVDSYDELTRLAADLRSIPLAAPRSRAVLSTLSKSRSDLAMILNTDVGRR